MFTSEHVYYPTYPLNQFVECIWMGKGEELNISMFHHAPLFTELIFTFDGNFKMDGQEVISEHNTSYTYTLSGLKTKPFRTINTGNYYNVGFILKPFCYGSLKRMSQSDYNNLADCIYKNICMPELPDFRPVAEFMKQWSVVSDMDTDLLKFERYVNTSLINKGGLAYFNTLISVSQKGFIHKFKKQYTLTPGKYVQLVQVNKAIQLIQNKTGNNLTEIGLDAGFYDQAHFTRVFKSFCGVTPKAFTLPKLTAGE